MEESNGELSISVEDNGIGGADPDRGSGLQGLEDRIEALGSRLRVQSPEGKGTLLNVLMPLDPLDEKFTNF